MKSILKHICLFFIFLLALYFILVATAAIPNEYISANFKKTAEFLATQEEFAFSNTNRVNSIQDNYADTILLNVAYRMGGNNPFYSALDTMYYNGEQLGEAFGLYATVNEIMPANTDYTRYWHGSSAPVRMLALFCDINGMRIVGLCAFLVLLAVNVAYLIKLKKYKIAICLLLSLVAVQIWNIGLSLEYQAPFIICFLLMPFYIHLERKNNKLLSYLSVIGGASVAFFDFLTTETVTILFPLAIVCAIRMHEGRNKVFKKDFPFYLKNSLSWLASYCGAYIVKWTLASLVTGENKFIAAFTSVNERVSGNTMYYGSNLFEKVVNSIAANFTALFYGTTRADATIGIGVTVICLFFAATLLYVLNKPKAHGKGILMLLSSVVVIRFIVLNNHSFIHAFFTYRALSAMIFTLLCAISLQTGGKKNEKA